MLQKSYMQLFFLCNEINEMHKKSVQVGREFGATESQKSEIHQLTATFTVEKS